MTFVAVIGAGNRAAEWATRFLASGLDVRVDDSTLRDTICELWPAAQHLGLFPGSDVSRLQVADSPADIADAALVQVVAGAVPPGVNGLVATEEVARGCSPIHLVPLVEVSGPNGAALTEFYRSAAEAFDPTGAMPIER